MSETNIRKKVEMRNLAIYCNYGKQELLTQKDSDKNVEQKLLDLIFLSDKLSATNKNNYILVMNVLGVVD